MNWAYMNAYLVHGGFMVQNGDFNLTMGRSMHSFWCGSSACYWASWNWHGTWTKPWMVKSILTHTTYMSRSWYIYEGLDPFWEDASGAPARCSQNWEKSFWKTVTSRPGRKFWSTKQSSCSAYYTGQKHWPRTAGTWEVWRNINRSTSEKSLISAGRIDAQTPAYKDNT